MDSGLKLYVYVFITFISTSAMADDYDDGLLAYYQGDYKQARVSLQKSAQQGDTGAYLMLANLYSEAKGGPKDSAKALYWLEKAANSGTAEAQYQMGENRLKQKKYPQAFRWFTAASEQGHAKAYFQQALMLSQGNIKDYSSEKLVQLYSVAASELDVFAQKGDAYAQNGLAYMYERGLGVIANPYTALAWYQRAAQQGYTEAQFNLGRLLALNEKQQAESLYWLQAAAQQGHQGARKILRDQGKGVALK